MSTPILATKLYIPPPRPKTVPRSHLIERLNEGLHRKLTLISAPAGFGKTTLVSGWVAGGERPAAWLSLDEGDDDPTRFLMYLVTALQNIQAELGVGILEILQSLQPPSPEAILTTLLNEIAAIPDNFILVLDDYHVLEAPPIGQALTFLLEYLPPQMHLVIVSREDPPLPLARYRARDQMTELRSADLRFTPREAAEFLNQGMGLTLSAEDIAALESRTEGWIAGLQLAAISMQGQQDTASFIESFTGSHHFVLDYLVEEVLQQQPEDIQNFLLQTSILDRMTGSLCEAVTGQEHGQQILIDLNKANLFLIPLDNERWWYRYHQLFADLLRQRLGQLDEERVSEFHLRASRWYETEGLELQAFQHAAAANDVARAMTLMEGDGMPLHLRGMVAPVLDWLAALPQAVLDDNPSLWTSYADVLMAAGQLTEVEPKLQAAETALKGVEVDEDRRDLVGRIAAIRAMLSAPQYQVETIIAQARRALDYLHPDNLPVRTSVTRMLGYAYHFQGDRAAAGQAYAEAMAMSEASGNTFIDILASTGLGLIQEAGNQLQQAAETYRRVLQLVGDPPQPMACEAYLGLARLFYEWNDLEAAQEHGQLSLELARAYGNLIDSTMGCNLLLGFVKLAQGDTAGAAAQFATAEAFGRQHNFLQQMPEVAAAQVLAQLQQGDLAAAAVLAGQHDLPLSQARVHLAQGDPSAALAVLAPWRQQMETRNWQAERLKALVLQAVAQHVYGETEQAVDRLEEALTLAEPGGFIRTFVDEGAPMAQLLYTAAQQGIMAGYTVKLLDAFEVGKPVDTSPPTQPLVEPLSKREIEVLELIAAGLTNREISQRLFLSIDTVKGHNRRIFSKLGVKNRTHAVNKAVFLKIISRK